jgi:HSP20 family protein
MFWDEDFNEEIARIHEEMDRLFNRMFMTNRPLLGFERSRRELAKYHGFRMPAADIQETESGVIATFEIPGVDKKDINLNVTENSIEVRVEKKAEKEEKKKGSYIYKGLSSSFYRRLPLPAEVNAEKASATYKNGILRVEIPKTKKEKEKKKRILIN